MSTAALAPGGAEAPPGAPRVFSRSDLVIMLGSVAAMALSAATFYGHVNTVVAFICSAIAIALLAALVGRCVERLGDRLGAGATGVLQSALGNLPELFISFFALRKGYLIVVQSALIGSILANLLLVLGLAFLVGGLKNGTQRFEVGRARSTCILMTLATAALVLPSLASFTHSPAGQHEKALSVALAIVLLVIFALSLPASLRRTRVEEAEGAGEVGYAVKEMGTDDATHHEGHWPIWLAVVMLALAGVGAGLVSDWFVDALNPAMTSLHISQAFAGLVIVAIAGNAVENVVGIQLAMRNKAEYALSVIINSPLQISLVLAPLLVLLSFFTATTLTLVFAPLLIAAVVVAVLITSLIVLDGESNWLEGSILIGLYAMIATLFWWG
ncbi:MAG TPA: calcium/proton exchanger [Micromonosporaceae bacterium]|jgi:Ca2+:H+ antiporter